MIDLNWIWSQVQQIIDPWDIVAVFVVFVATHLLKPMMAKRWRPLTAFGLGFIVAIFMWAAGIIYMWNHIFFYGAVYGATAAFARNLWKYTIKGEE